MRSELALPLPNELMVVFGPHAGTAMMLDLAARLALRGPLCILDCGNRSNMYRVARTLRPLTTDPAAMLKNIRLSRAFTCYQVLSLLEKLQPRAGVPVLILDLLSTFMDESVQVEESVLLFEKTLRGIDNACQFAPVVVSAKPLLSISSPRLALLTQLKRQASQVWEELSLLPAVPVETQPPLFDETWR
ncbi:MAG: hypothetical protein FD147_2431 [Chloroflexi bacterium]|nr:MAG: hypothetical protein FD147_2431 [Chloroflexota bacterium]